MSRERAAVPSRRVTLLVPVDLYHWLKMRQATYGHRSFGSYINVLLTRFRREVDAGDRPAEPSATAPDLEPDAPREESR